MTANEPNTSTRWGRKNVHETHYLHRGSAAAPYAEGAEGIFRLLRSRLLCRGNAARQPGRFAGDQIASAHPHRRVEARYLDDHPGRTGSAAADPGAGRADRDAI